MSEEAVESRYFLRCLLLVVGGSAGFSWACSWSSCAFSWVKANGLSLNHINDCPGYGIWVEVQGMGVFGSLCSLAFETL